MTFRCDEEPRISNEAPTQSCARIPEHRSKNKATGPPTPERACEAGCFPPLLIPLAGALALRADRMRSPHRRITSWPLSFVLPDVAPVIKAEALPRQRGNVLPVQLSAMLEEHRGAVKGKLPTFSHSFGLLNHWNILPVL